MKKQSILIFILFTFYLNAQNHIIYFEKLNQNIDLSKYKLIKKCPCDANLFLFEYSSNSIPDPNGQVNKDVKPDPIGQVNKDVKPDPNGQVNKDVKPDGYNYLTVADTIDFIRKANGILASKKNNNSNEVIVAITDSGVDFDNSYLTPFLDNRYFKDTNGKPKNTNFGKYGANILENKDDKYPNPIDEWNHGTFINGIIAGYANLQSVKFREGSEYEKTYNASDINIKLMNIKIYENEGTVNKLFDALCGIQYALDKGAKVINASWNVIGGKEVRNYFLPIMEDIVKKNAVLVVAIGNEPGKDFENDSLKSWPGAFSNSNLFKKYENNIICVGGFNYREHISSKKSSIATYVDVIADSDSLISFTLNDNKGRIGIWSGTSFATPVISRLLAIEIGRNSGSYNAIIKENVFNILATSHYFSFTMFKALNIYKKPNIDPGPLIEQIRKNRKQLYKKQNNKSKSNK